MNATPKHVVSTTLDKAEWQNSTLLKGDLAKAVTELKAKPGKNRVARSSPVAFGFAGLGVLRSKEIDPLSQSGLVSLDASRTVALSRASAGLLATSGG
jgi:hypothetical protein